MSWVLYADDGIPELVTEDTIKRALAFWVVPKSGSIRIQRGSIVRFLSHGRLTLAGTYEQDECPPPSNDCKDKRTVCTL